jgi:hypothetical protein
MPHAASFEAVNNPDRSGFRLGGDPLSRDHRLELARRIDWRFLLADPRLGRISVGGRPDDGLLAALGAATRDEDGPAGVTRVSDDGEEADSVVLSGAFDPAEFAAAAAAAAPRGRLVVEIDRARFGRTGGLSSLATGVRITRSLTAGGWSARTWFAWPHRSGATSWAATDDHAAVRALMARRFPTGPLRVAGGLAAGRAGRRLLEVVAPTLTVVAERSGEVPRLWWPHHGPDGGGDAAGLLLLTPRYRASAHVVALRIDGATGHPDQVVKISRLPDDQGPAREGAILARLAAATPACGRWPAAISVAGIADGWPAVSETTIVGRPLSPDVVRSDPRAAAGRVEALLAALPIRPPGARDVPVHERLSKALAVIRAIAEGPGAELRPLADRASAVFADLDGMELPVVFEHGDPAHPNLILLEDGRLGAVDWERGEADGLPLHDLSIALAYIAAAERRATEPQAQATAFTEALQRRDGWAAPALAHAAARSGIDARLGRALVVAAWTRSVAWLATAVEASVADRTTVDWLMGDRAVALWRTSLAMADAG